MQPRMSVAETELFRKLVSTSRHYVEFGSGGSTVLAAQLVAESIVSVDSSTQWLDDVRTACTRSPGLAPDLIHVDIGPTGEWGYPTDPATAPRWPSYHTAIWAKPAACEADTYLVDGRFRVACFMQILLHARAAPLIAIHDFSRPAYHVVKEFAQEVARAQDLSLFRADPRFDRATAAAVLRAHETTPG